MKCRFRLRKTLFSPLNYGDQIGGGRMPGLNEGEQLVGAIPITPRETAFVWTWLRKGRYSELIQVSGAFAVHVHRDQERDRAGDRTCLVHRYCWFLEALD